MENILKEAGFICSELISISPSSGKGVTEQVAVSCQSRNRQGTKARDNIFSRAYFQWSISSNKGVPIEVSKPQSFQIGLPARDPIFNI